MGWAVLVDLDWRTCGESISVYSIKKKTEQANNKQIKLGTGEPARGIAPEPHVGVLPTGAPRVL